MFSVHTQTDEVQDTVPELHSGSEGLMLCDGEDQQEALPTAKVVVPDGSVVLLAGCVQNVDLDLLPIQNHLLPVAVCLGGLVVLHKLKIKRYISLDILKRKTGCK